jgi:hypothetical protein
MYGLNSGIKNFTRMQISRGIPQWLGILDLASKPKKSPIRFIADQKA